VVLVDQQPIGRTPRSNPVTYLKAFDPIREIFATTKDAKSRGLTASHFSFNVPGGRCEACQGEGEVRVEMQFLADVFVPCDQCEGRRFKANVLEVRYKGKNVHQVLDMTVREAITFFSGSPKVLRKLHVLDEIGLGTFDWANPRPRSPAARRSASRSPPISRRSAAIGCSISSTSRRPACTSMTSRSCSRLCAS
jgi:excinuclease ABC subunit A